jgi:hypothetical protein
MMQAASATIGAARKPAERSVRPERSAAKSKGPVAHGLRPHQPASLRKASAFAAQGCGMGSLASGTPEGAVCLAT